MKWKNWNLARNAFNDPMSIRSQPHRNIFEAMESLGFLPFIYRFDTKNLMRTIQQIPVL